MTAKAIVSPLFVVMSSFIEFIFRSFVRKHRQTPTVQEVFENDARETVREIEGRELVVEIPDEDEEFTPVFENDASAHSPEVRAPKGIALRKLVLFRTHRGEYRSAKVVGWESDGTLILSRKNGPPFRRRLAVS